MRVTSTQKLPMPSASRRAKPRINASDRDADRRRDEIVHRQPRHLHEVAHRRFRHIGLPVGVGDEADPGVERQHRLDPGLALRVQRQMPLQALP
jgi:hypothetical protein